MKVIVSLNDGTLARYLRSRTEPMDFVCLDEKSDPVHRLVRRDGFNEIRTDTWDGPTKSRLIQSYIDLIGKLGRKYNSIYWWTTFTAAKNRFASRLSNHLFLFYAITRRLGEKPANDLLLVNPPREMLGALNQYCREKSIELIVLRGSWLSDVPRVFRGLLLSPLHRWFFVAQTCRKIYLARQHLRGRLASAMQHRDRYYVLKTLFYSDSITESGDYRDSVFRILVDHLAAREKRVLVLASVMGDYAANVKKMADHEKNVILPLELLLKYLDPIRALLDLGRNRVKIEGRVEFEGADVSDMVQRELNREFAGAGIIAQYLSRYWVQRLAQAFAVDTFVGTCENNPWERLSAGTLREYSPETRIVGYQHTVVPQASANMFLSKYEKDVVPMPDRILTVGEITKQIMERYGDYEAGKIEPACALRYDYLFDVTPKPRTRSKRILVVLEGVIDVYHLANHVLDQLQGNPEFRVTIRSHPALPMRKIAHLIHHDIGSIPNFAVSDGVTLEQDIEQSDIVVYWGSTVALEALAMGKPIVHFDMGTVLSYDPLFECNHLKWIVNSDRELVTVLQEIYNLSDEEFDLQRNQAREYLDRYFYRVTDERLGRFVT